MNRKIITIVSIVLILSALFIGITNPVIAQSDETTGADDIEGEESDQTENVEEREESDQTENVEERRPSFVSQMIDRITQIQNNSNNMTGQEIAASFQSLVHPVFGDEHPSERAQDNRPDQAQDNRPDIGNAPNVGNNPTDNR